MRKNSHLHDASEGRRLALVTRSLTPYTRNFFDCVAEARSEDATLLIIGRREQDWINPWDQSLLLPRVADHNYASARSIGTQRPILLPSRSQLATLRRFRPDIVAIQEFSIYCAFAAFWAMARHVPVVSMTEIGDDYGPPYPALGKSQKLLHRILLSKSKGVIALTPDAARRAKQRKKPHILAPHAIDTKEFCLGAKNSVPDAPIVLMTAGNFIYRKGHDLLLKALGMVNKRLAGKHPWILKCHGSGETRDLRELAAKLNIGERVEFHSFLGEADLIRAYQAADIFTLTSRRDTYGVVLHEASACGLPLVGSTLAGASELLIQEGVNGFRVDPNDTARVADALHEIIINRRLRGEFSQNSRRIAEKWDVRENAQRAAQWLNHLLG